MTQYLILLKQGSNIISYNSKQRSNVSRTFLFIKKSLSIARVSFNEPRLPKNTLGINEIVCFFFLISGLNDGCAQLQSVSLPRLPDC